MNKQVTNLDREQVMWRAKNGLALNLKELSLVSGYGYSRWLSWKFRGLPLIYGRIQLKRAMDWIASAEMAPESRTSQVFDMCEDMALRMHDIRSQLRWKASSLAKMRGKTDEERRREICWSLDSAIANYYALRREIDKPLPSTKLASRAPEDLSVGGASVSAEPYPKLSLPLTFTKEEKRIMYKAHRGMALNLRELAFVLGFSYSAIGRWVREGLPLIDGKTTKDEAWTWRRANVKIRKAKLDHDYKTCDGDMRKWAKAEILF